MGEIMDQLPSEIQAHIKGITKSSGLPDTEESYETMAEGWLNKKSIFEEQIIAQNMVEVESLDMNDEKGAVALTYSGSLVLIGPLVDGSRKAGYNSIGVRRDVPDSIVKEGSTLAADVKVNNPINFEVGPVKSTSSIFKIAVCEEALDALKQEQKIQDVTVMLTDEFVNVNKDLIPVD